MAVAAELSITGDDQRWEEWFQPQGFLPPPCPIDPGLGIQRLVGFL